MLRVYPWKSISYKARPLRCSWYKNGFFGLYEYIYRQFSKFHKSLTLCHIKPTPLVSSINSMTLYIAMHVIQIPVNWAPLVLPVVVMVTQVAVPNTHAGAQQSLSRSLIAMFLSLFILRTKHSGTTLDGWLLRSRLCSPLTSEGQTSFLWGQQCNILTRDDRWF